MSQSCFQTANVAINSTELAPCDSTRDPSTASLCCTPSQICLTNGLCATNEGFFYSGGCTDETYKAAICPKFCTSPGDSFVVRCTSSSSLVKDGDFCCSPNGLADCCQNSVNALGLEPSKSSAIAGTLTSPGITPVGSQTPPPTSTRTLTLVSVTSAAPNPPSASAWPPEVAKGIPVVPLALGLGLGLGIPLAMFALYMLWRRVKRLQSKDRPRQPSEGMHGIAETEPKVATTDPTRTSSDKISELPTSSPIAISSALKAFRLKDKSDEPVEMSTASEVPSPVGPGTLSPLSRIVPDHNPRRPQDGYLGAVTATQGSGYLSPH